MKLDDMRVHYDRDELRREDSRADPLEQFALWMNEACEEGKSDIRNPRSERNPRTEGRRGFKPAARADSDLGVRACFGFRISAFGFRLACVLLLLCSLHSFAAAPRVLVYQRNGKGFVHDNLAASAAAIRELGEKHGFGVDVSSNASVFMDATLKRYQAILFVNSNNEAFENDDQRAAFERFLRRGGGFTGIHSSTGSERQWVWFQQVQGAKFLRHAPMQKFAIEVLDRKHSATAHLGSTWERTDECYFFTNVNPAMRVLLAADTNSLRDPKLASAPGQKVNGVFPLAWCHESGGGRRFYTSLGHKIEHYSDPVFRQHLVGGILWVLKQENQTSIATP